MMHGSRTAANDKHLSIGELRKKIKQRSASRGDDSSSSSIDEDSVDPSISSCDITSDDDYEEEKPVVCRPAATVLKTIPAKRKDERSRSISPASANEATLPGKAISNRRKQRSASNHDRTSGSFVSDLRSAEARRGLDCLRKPVTANRITRSPHALRVGVGKRLVDAVKPNTIDRGCSSQRVATKQPDGKVMIRRQREPEQERLARRSNLKKSLGNSSNPDLSLEAIMKRKGKSQKTDSGSAHQRQKEKMDFSVPPAVSLLRKNLALDDSLSSSTNSTSSSTSDPDGKEKVGNEGSPISTAHLDRSTSSRDSSINGSNSLTITIEKGELESDLDDSSTIFDSKNTKPPMATKEDDDGSCDDDISLNFDSIADHVEEKSTNVIRLPSKAHTSVNHNRSVGNLNSSLGNLNKSLGDIATSGSDEQWSRFKSMGRAGLGEIEPSPAAQTLIKQNVKVFLSIMQKIIALRDEEPHVDLDSSDILLKEMNRSSDIRTGNLLEEVRETVEIRKTRARYKRHPNEVVLAPNIVAQLQDFVTAIAVLYRDNPFHNFEHASTVLGAVNKVVSLANPPEDIDYTDIRFITTDPWTHFALVFSALIHDVDHQGVPNSVLVEENATVAQMYNNKSVAEQNSLEIAWTLLLEPCYREMRDALFQNNDEVLHFRRLVVTATLATDIADKELASMRRDRAAEALAVLEDGFLPTTDDIASQKATFVLETLIQVADVSHLMMPFAWYKRWNYKLLRENYKAFVEGRAECDPLDSWWKGEFGFFDFYIIPLAQKLDKCGIDSTYYVRNAEDNRKKWEELGEGLVAEYAKQLRAAQKPMSAHLVAYSTSTHSKSVKKGKKKTDDAHSKDRKSGRTCHSSICTSSKSLSSTMSDGSGNGSFVGGSERGPRSSVTASRKGKKKHSVAAATDNKERKSSEKIRKPPTASKSFSDAVLSTHKKRTTKRISKTDDTDATDSKPVAKTRTGSVNTAIPDGERRYLQRSKSSSSVTTTEKIEVGRRGTRTRPERIPTTTKPAKSSSVLESSSLDAGSRTSLTTTTTTEKKRRSKSLSTMKTTNKDRKTKRSSKTKKDDKIQQQ